MATTPDFVSVPRLGVASVSTANTARDGTGTIATILTGVDAGTVIYRVVLSATNDPADSTVTLFLHDGTTTWYFDELDLGNPAAASATTPPGRWEKAYRDLILPSSSWSLRAAITVAPTAGVVNVFAMGGDLT